MKWIQNVTKMSQKEVENDPPVTPVTPVTARPHLWQHRGIRQPPTKQWRPNTQGQRFTTQWQRPSTHRLHRANRGQRLCNAQGVHALGRYAATAAS